MGCLHIGAPTAEEPDSIARHVSVEEAIEYTKFAIDKGLIPYVGRLEVDHTLWGIYSGEPFITVCFCCTCCCQQLVSYKYEHPTNRQFKWKPLDGVKMKIDISKCVGEYCGVTFVPGVQKDASSSSTLARAAGPAVKRSQGIRTPTLCGCPFRNLGKNRPARGIEPCKKHSTQPRS